MSGELGPHPLPAICGERVASAEGASRVRGNGSPSYDSDLRRALPLTPPSPRCRGARECTECAGSLYFKHKQRCSADGCRSNLDLLVLHHALDGGTLEHAVLEHGVILELRHRQLAADSPGVEDEAIGIEHGVLVGKPFPSRQLAVDLLQVAVEGLEARFL